MENISTIENVNTAPVMKLPTKRGWLKTILFSIITLGIYSLVMFSNISSEINLIASRYDDKKTIHFCLLVFIVAPITLGVAAIVWYHRISNRIGNELVRRGIDYKLSAGTFWGWNVLGCLLFGIGPFIYLHKLCKSMNLLCDDYNTRG